MLWLELWCKHFNGQDLLFFLQYQEFGKSLRINLKKLDKANQLFFNQFPHGPKVTVLKKLDCSNKEKNHPFALLLLTR